MRALWIVALLAGCGSLQSGSGAPTNPPASGVGPTTPFSDVPGLSWSAPFILADPARACSHPTVLVDGEALDVWVGVVQGEQRYIAHAHADDFARGFGELERVLQPDPPSTEVSTPAIVRVGDQRLLFYLSAGTLRVARRDSERGFSPFPQEALLYADALDPIDSMSAALYGDHVRFVLLVGGRIDELDVPLGEVEQVPPGPTRSVARSTGLTVPSWAVDFLDVSLRIERTPAGRLRQDVLFAAALPNALDLGAQPIPTAVGAASRYLPDDPAAPAPPFEQTAAPILSGPPQPRGPTAVSYRGGVLLLYSARSGARDAIAVAVHP